MVVSRGMASGSGSEAGAQDDRAAAGPTSSRPDSEMSPALLAANMYTLFILSVQWINTLCRTLFRNQSGYTYYE